MSNSKKFLAARGISLTGISCAQASEFAGFYAGVKRGRMGSRVWCRQQAVPRPACPRPDRRLGLDAKQFVIGVEVFADFHRGSTACKDDGGNLKVGMPFNTIMPYAR